MKRNIRRYCKILNKYFSHKVCFTKPSGAFSATNFSYTGKSRNEIGLVKRLAGQVMSDRLVKQDSQKDSSISESVKTKDIKNSNLVKTQSIENVCNQTLKQDSGISESETVIDDNTSDLVKHTNVQLMCNQTQESNSGVKCGKTGCNMDSTLVDVLCVHKLSKDDSRIRVIDTDGIISFNSGDKCGNMHTDSYGHDIGRKPVT